MKSVCIIGSGPGGLVAAKTFLQRGFNVTVYEKDDKVGGIWAFPKQSGSDGYLSPWTPTNLSKFTVGFSDLSWRSLGAGEGHVPMFPAAEQVGQYLELYRSRYVPDSTFKFRHRVVSVDHLEHDDGNLWKVVSETKVDGSDPGDSAGANTKQEIAYFDYVINAAGFFSKPTISSRLITPSKIVKEVHTSEFRELDDLFAKGGSHAGKHILVYGGGNSAGEVASNIAFQLSSSQHRPKAYSDSDKFKGVKVYHVTPRPLYAVPPFVPGDKANTFIPLDLKIYDLKWRQPGPIKSQSGSLSPEAAAARYTGIHGAVGDQKDLGAEALVTKEETTPYATLSESYSEFVRAGLIIPIAGRVRECKPQDADTVAAKVTTNSGNLTIIHNIAASVVANGYTPTASLSFLSPSTKQALSYDPTSTRLPILLQNYQTLNPAVPDLGFVGFYEGPYWGVMEMQARLLAARWSGSEIPIHADESLQRLEELRKAMKQRGKEVPQYWFSDYIGYLEEISSELGMERNDGPFPDGGTGPLSPARYLASTDAKEEAVATMEDLKTAVDDCANGKYRARAVFRALHGQWDIERWTEGEKYSAPFRSFKGSGTFHPRAPSKEGIDLEYLYVESGEGIYGGEGRPMTMTSSSVYRYVEATDTLTIWTANGGSNVAGSCAQEFEFCGVEEEEEGGRCVARAVGVGQGNEYSRHCYFEFRAVALGGWEEVHEVPLAHEGAFVERTVYRRAGDGGEGI